MQSFEDICKTQKKNFCTKRFNFFFLAKACCIIIMSEMYKASLLQSKTQVLK